RLHPKAEAFLDAQYYRVTVHPMGPGNGLITQTGDRVQQDRRAHRPPLLLGARFAQALQHALLVLAEDQEPAPPRKGHAPLKHFRLHMSSYLENYDLATFELEKIGGH